MKTHSISKSTLRQVEKGLTKANRVRNLFAVLAVILTTFLIATVFSLGFSYITNMQISQIRQAGTTANASLNMPSRKQEEQIKALDYVISTGHQIEIGTADQVNEAGNPLNIALMYCDSDEWENHFREAVSDIKGSYPSATNEIMLNMEALSQMGISSPSIGMEIPLSYTDKNGEHTDTFLLSGWFRDYSGAGKAVFSEAWCRSSGYRTETDGILSIRLSNPAFDLSSLEADIDLAEGQSFNGIGTPGSSSGNSIVIIAAMLVLFIMASGYLLIYNVLYISITKDTRFYGLLRAVGASRRQVRSLVKRQAFKFACVGIPVGIVLAALVSVVLVPFVLRAGYTGIDSKTGTVVSFQPLIFLFSILFSALTVWISCSLPAKTAAKISPTEALRYQNFAPKKQKSRRSRNGGSLFVMAFHNIFRDKKRALLVFLSLFMGTVSILGVNGVLGSLTADKYIENYTNYSFEFLDDQFFVFPGPEGEFIPQYSEDFVSRVSATEGVSGVHVSYGIFANLEFDGEQFSEMLDAVYSEWYVPADQSRDEMMAEIQDLIDRNRYGTYIFTVEDSQVEAWNQSHGDSIDLEAFRRGDTAIVSGQWYDEELTGKELTFTADAQDGKPASFRVDGYWSYGEYRNSHYPESRYDLISIVAPEAVLVSEQGMKRLTDQALICDIGVDIDDPSQLDAVDARLQELSGTLTGAYVDLVSAAGQRDTWNTFFSGLSVLGNGASILLILVGLINFVNVMLTGVIARKNEFAIMESVGMTKRQIRRTLTMEGGLYALITTGLILTLGNGFLLLVSRAVPGIADYAKFEYPVSLVVLLILSIFVICLSVPPLVYHCAARETIIERLHSFEN
ncbi:ABC transporter permease [Lachnoclostridium sp. An169]|uniref:ABC transporter permease n=1 Tax=Lachnoclostridium sp. An169 TaxID=1965569 RepID=UPI000B382402|nr:ABC transporter permease [Lachnoclostridium sp. An169]OUP85356.1 ABC transporter permease [Lachnoclostridium sp. An169]